MSDHGADAALGWLLDASHMVRVDEVPRLAREAAKRLGVADLHVYVVDYEQTVLVRISDADEDADLPIEGTDSGRAFTRVEVVASEDAEGTLWVPMLDGTERVGVVEFIASSFDEGLREACRRLTGLIAELVVTRKHYGDFIEMKRRRRRMTLPAEIQWKLLPPLTYTTPRVAIACILAPCYDVGGDAFDYAVDDSYARFAIFDAMGHGLDASLMATVTLGAYRGARRRGMELEETHAEIDRAIASHFAPDRFVTGIVAELELATGEFRRINAGHPGTLKMGTDGSVTPLTIPDRTVPFGLGGKPAVIHSKIELGERLILYTDGVIEARDRDSVPFGIERLAESISRRSAAGHPAPEILRGVIHELESHQDGSFRDDATILTVEWRGVEAARMSFD